MDRIKEENFRKFEGNLKILSIRAKYAGDEKAEEYMEIVDKLEQIRKNRHLAMLGEENVESKLYSQLLDVVGNNNNDTMYTKIKELLSDYSLKSSEEKQNMIDFEEER